jgi:hypothetical protein
VEALTVAAPPPIGRLVGNEQTSLLGLVFWVGKPMALYVVAPVDMDPWGAKVC